MKLDIYNLLYDIYADQLALMRFFPNKGKTEYSLIRKEKRKKMDLFRYKFIFTRKNVLHLNFSYTNLVLEDIYYQLELAIQEAEDLDDFLRIKKKCSRPVIVITDWLDFLEKNQFNSDDYNQWLTQIHTDSDLANTLSTYNTIFSLVQENIVNKISTHNHIYEYLLNKTHISCTEFQFMLLLHSSIDKDITEIYEIISVHCNYQNMNDIDKKRLDLSYKLIPLLDLATDTKYKL